MPPAAPSVHFFALSAPGRAPDDPMTRLVVGLGNPGPEYRWTRHNIGFEAVDALAGELGLFFRPASKLDGYSGSRRFEWARAEASGALLVKPTTFMNRSGPEVDAALGVVNV